MTASDSKSFLSWGLTRSTTPKLETDKDKDKDKDKKDEPLKSSGGADHLVTHRQPPSLRRYPKECPPLRTRWFYAVDVPKRKPFTGEPVPEDKSKPASIPKKFIPFSLTDSQAIEAAFQTVTEHENSNPEQRTGGAENPTKKVPVNEDYLFDVDIEKRELEPAYWLGPVYEVRRGSWFYPENPPRPCDENLANQLEEGYVKLKPWEHVSIQAARASSQPRSRPSSMIVDKSNTETGGSVPGTPKLGPSDSKGLRNDQLTYRLFGAYMNSSATYYDATTAYVTADDFMSRMSSTVYSRFGSVGGTKVVRGYPEPVQSEPKPVEASTTTSSKRKSAPPGSLTATPEKPAKPSGEPSEPQDAPKRSTLERQLSSLAGAGESTEDLAEEARKQEEKEMEDYRETEGDDQGRQIDHLVLVTHGIGQRLGLRLDSVNFVHDVNTMRKSMKAVYANSPDLQALNSQINELPKNSRIQVLPVCWRHMLDFPKQSLRNNRKELDLTDLDAMDEDEYPSLADITVDGVPAVRNLITDLAMDVLLYQSAYREHIAGIVQRECNRIFKLFKERNPTFSGRVSLVGHSLGSAILFDLLCRQKDQTGIPVNLKMPSRKKSRTRASTNENLSLDLDFNCENFFCIGSPIALFQMLKGRTISARQKFSAQPLASPFDPDTMDDPFATPTGAGGTSQKGKDAKPVNLLPVTVSSPKCQALYNIFHPTDPISYRIEPLISPAMSALKPQPLPYTKRGLFAAPGIANIGAYVGQSVGSMWYNFTSGVASSLLNRSLGITGEEQALSQDGKTPAQLRSQVQGTGTSGTASTPTLIVDEKKQQALAEQARDGHFPGNPDQLPTLIDSELETLYAGFQKRRRSQNVDNPDGSKAGDDLAGAPAGSSAWEEAEERARRLKREEAKVRALNSNGRVDYSIQEGVFDISLLASIASHLSYWSDTDVNHFIMSQMLSKPRVKSDDEPSSSKQ